MKKIQKLSFLFLLAVALIFGMQLSKNQAEAKVPAKTLKEVSRLMKGKYDYYGQQGLYKVRYAKWKNDHFVWYCDGKKSNDDKVYKIKKVNAKKYIFYFKKHGKYR